MGGVWCVMDSSHDSDESDTDEGGVIDLPVDFNAYSPRNLRSKVKVQTVEK